MTASADLEMFLRKADGTVRWLVVHHSLDGREQTEPNGKRQRHTIHGQHGSNHDQDKRANRTNGIRAGQRLSAGQSHGVGHVPFVRFFRARSGIRPLIQYGL